MFGLFGKPSKENFAELVRKRIKAAGGPGDWTVDLDAFEIRSGNNRGFLQNTYTAYCQAKGDHRETILANFVRALVTPEKDITFDEARDKLVAVVRERALFANTSLLWRIDGVDRPPKQQSEPLSTWFARALVIDEPSQMSLVNEAQVAAWGITSDEAFSIGLNKLRECTIPKFSVKDDVYSGNWHDDFDSSRILVPGLFRRLPFKGDPVVCLPNRLSLLVADSENIPAVRTLLKRSEEIMRESPKPQNPSPLVIRNDAISDFLVPRTSPLFPDVARARGVAAASTCTEQKARLEQLYARTKKDLFVADFALQKSDAGEYWSYSVWSNGVPTLLPETDVVMFFDPGRPEKERFVGRADWGQVRKIADDLMLDTGMFPPRYYVSKFPDAAQLVRLCAGGQ